MKEKARGNFVKWLCLVLILCVIFALSPFKRASGMTFDTRAQPAVERPVVSLPVPHSPPQVVIKKPVLRVKAEGGIRGYDPKRCVSFVKYKTGYSKSVGNARDWPRAAIQEPAQGGVIILLYPSDKRGHVAYIAEVKENSLIIEDTNYSPGRYTKREIPLNYPFIIGYGEI